MRRAGLLAVRIVAAMVSLAIVAASSSVAAADSESRLWYFNDFGVQAAFDAGYSGQGVTIAVIDTQINPSVPALQGTNLSIHEPALCDVDSSNRSRLPATSSESGAYHGTNMVALILGNGAPPPEGQTGQLGVAPGATVKYYASNVSADSSGQIQCIRDGEVVQGDNTAEAIDLAVADGAQIISMSFTGNYQQNVLDAVARALRVGTVIVTATPNDASPVFGLATMNGVVAIQAMDETGAIQSSSLKSDPAIDIVAPGVGILGVSQNWQSTATISGTSEATAITAGFLAVVKSKYPAATGNQLIQGLVRNTSQNDHPQERDPAGVFGYGIVSLASMLADDPTQLPDVNPLIENPGYSPSYEEIFGNSTVASGSKPTNESSTDEPSGALGALPVVLLIVLVILVTGAIVTTVLVVRKRKEISR